MEKIFLFLLLNSEVDVFYLTRKNEIYFLAKGKVKFILTTQFNFPWRRVNT